MVDKHHPSKHLREETEDDDANVDVKADKSVTADFTGTTGSRGRVRNQDLNGTTRMIIESSKLAYRMQLIAFNPSFAGEEDARAALHAFTWSCLKHDVDLEFTGVFQGMVSYTVTICLPYPLTFLTSLL